MITIRAVGLVPQQVKLGALDQVHSEASAIITLPTQGLACSDSNLKHLHSVTIPPQLPMLLEGERTTREPDLDFSVIPTISRAVVPLERQTTRQDLVTSSKAGHLVAERVVDFLEIHKHPKLQVCRLALVLPITRQVVSSATLIKALRLGLAHRITLVAADFLEILVRTILSEQPPAVRQVQIRLARRPQTIILAASSAIWPRTTSNLQEEACSGTIMLLLEARSLGRISLPEIRDPMHLETTTQPAVEAYLAICPITTPTRTNRIKAVASLEPTRIPVPPVVCSAIHRLTMPPKTTTTSQPASLGALVRTRIQMRISQVVYLEIRMPILAAIL